MTRPEGQQKMISINTDESSETRRYDTNEVKVLDLVHLAYDFFH